MARQGRYHRTCRGSDGVSTVNAIPEKSTRLDFWDLTKVVFRRWKISLPLLILSIAATGAIAATAKPDYTETTYIQLVPLSTGVQNSANSALTNPLSAGGLNAMGQAVIYATQDQGFLDSLKAAGHTTNFTLTMTYPNPIVTIEVDGKTEADTVETAHLVVRKFQDSALAMQKAYGVKDQDLITTQRLDQTDNVKPSGGKVKRAIIAVAAAGFLLTSGLTIAIDAIARRRTRRRREAEDKINPLAIELALARADAVPAPTNGDRGDLLPKIPAVRIEPVVPAQSAPPAPHVELAPRVEIPAQAAPVEPVTTQIQPTATPSDPAAPAESTQPIEAAGGHFTRPTVNKPSRGLKAGTYRSINASSEHEADPAHVPADAQGQAVSVPPDVTVVLPPEWAAGENGKRH